MKSRVAENVASYIAGFPEHIRQMLETMRATIKKTAKKGEEVISYNMPAFKQAGILVWYAGCKNHIGFYPSSLPIQVFKEELRAYKTTRGAIQFPLNQPLPLALIKKIVQFRMKEDQAKSTIKNKKK